MRITIINKQKNTRVSKHQTKEWNEVVNLTHNENGNLAIDIEPGNKRILDENEENSQMGKHQLVAIRLREFLQRRYEVRYNEVMQMTEFREKDDETATFRELDRRELNTIHYDALLEGIEPSFSEVEELVHSTFVTRFNPIEEYLQKLPAWDGHDRIAELAARVPTDNPHWERLFRQWMLSMVAHWMKDDEAHANSTAPILIGDQGFRKSTFCRQILPPELQMFYTDSIDFSNGKEAERLLSRFLLVNIDEFDRLTERQFASVKHLFQKTGTNLRRMRSESFGRQRRYTSFIGTTNCDEVLRDPTGNRRYLCVRVTNPINTETGTDYYQLYAQIVYLINIGERYWLNDEDESLIKETNKQFEQMDSLEMLFLSAFRPDNDTDGTYMRAFDIMAELRRNKLFNPRHDNNIIRLGRILSKHIPQKRRQNDGWRYLVERR